MSIYPEPISGELLEYAGERVDDVPQHICSISLSMLPFLYYGLDVLQHDEMWVHDPAYGELAVQAINELVAQLQVPATLAVSEGFTSMFLSPRELKTVGGLDTWAFDNTVANAAYAYNSAPIDNQLLVSFPVYLATGKYSLKYVSYHAFNRARTRFHLAGPSVQYLPWDDHYNAASIKNVLMEQVFDNYVAGNYTVNWRTHGKNPLSTGYYVVVSSLSLTLKQKF